MIVLDSSFLVALFDESDSFHKKAIKDMQEYEKKGEQFAISESILGETATVILYHSGLKQASAFLDFANENFSILWTDGKEELSGISVVFKNQKRQLSYADSSVVYFCRRAGGNPATYDKNILRELEPRKV
ncbi:MAG: type II toxin-antitoxin system VapC family toxin [Candidatus Micrarchaeia archaeon]